MPRKRKECKSIKELKDHYQKTDLVFETQCQKLIAIELLFIAESLDQIHSLVYQELKQLGLLMKQLSKIKKKREPSAYSLKVGQYMKAGKSLQEAHRLAKEER